MFFRRLISRKIGRQKEAEQEIANEKVLLKQAIEAITLGDGAKEFEVRLSK